MLFHRRGEGPPPLARLRHLFGDPACLVIHTYMGTDIYVEGSDRKRLLAEVEPYLQGKAGPPAGDHTDYEVAEFKAAGGKHALIVEESC